MTTPTKPCASCGRVITWRKAWERDWEQVRYCSAACRRRKLRPVDHALERAILDLLDERRRGSTICPSEAARAVAQHARTTEGSDASWRDLTGPARRAARRRVAAGEIEITQQDRVVDPSTATGPIRRRRVAR